MILFSLISSLTLFLAGSSESPLYALKVPNIEGELQSFEAYKGKVLLIVNTASACGFTKQYAGLQKLYEKYQKQGLVVLAFPSNQFGGQEPGSNQEIKMFCEENYKVSFPMFAKSDVKGANKNPVFAFLTESQKAKEPGWNFTKYLVGRDGFLIERFSQWTKPGDKDLLKAVESAL